MDRLSGWRRCKGDRRDLQRVLRGRSLSNTLLCCPNDAPQWNTTYFLIPLLKGPLFACSTLFLKPHLCVDNVPWDAGFRLQSSVLRNQVLSSTFYAGGEVGGVGGGALRELQRHTFLWLQNDKDGNKPKFDRENRGTGRSRQRTPLKRNHQRKLYSVSKVRSPQFQEVLSLSAFGIWELERHSVRVASEDSLLRGKARVLNVFILLI